MRMGRLLIALLLPIFIVIQVILIARFLHFEFRITRKIEDHNVVHSKNYIVPNIIHLIRFGNKSVTFIEAVSILAALKNQKPEKLIVHTDQMNFNGGKYWQVVIDHPSAKGAIEVVYLPQPENIFGKPYSKNYGLYHKSDTERLRVLMKYGGIYIDNDLFVVNNLNRFRFYEMTLGWEAGGGISDQIIIATKDARFLRVWLDSYRDYRADQWFYNGGILPTKLLEERPYLVNRVATRLAEWKYAPRLIYYDNSKEWMNHFAIHLLIGHQRELLRKDLSETAKYPVDFNETNILNYEANIKYMALSVYPFHKRKREMTPKHTYEFHTKEFRRNTATSNFRTMKY